MTTLDYDAIATAVSPDQLAQAIKAKKVRDGYRCPQPAHKNGDRNPSLSISRTNGRTVTFCHGCGLKGTPIQVAADVWGVAAQDAAQRLVRELGLSVPASNGLGEITDTYEYVDEAGEHLFEVVRYSFPKTFRQRVRHGQGWTWGLNGAKRALYRLPRVRTAVEEGRYILMVEGEKDVDRLEGLEFTATTNAGGAGKWRHEFTETLKGAKVAIIPDNDAPGRDHAITVARALHGVAEDVRVIELPNLPDTGDVSDWLDQGGTAEELRQLVKDAPTWQPSEVAPAQQQGEPSGESVRKDLPTLTDTGNADRLVALHGDRLHYVSTWGRWFWWDDTGRWDRDDHDVRVREAAKDVGYALKAEAAKQPDDKQAKSMFAYALQSLNARGISGMVDLARGIEGIPLDHEDLDADGWLLGVENGVVELRTGVLRDADPSDLMTKQCPVPYEPDAEAPRWEQALAEWFPDAEVRSYVQRIAGAALVGSQRDHVFIIHYGLGANGKGTFTRALQTVLGPYAIEIHLTLLVETKFREHDTVKADLFRVRLAVAVETDRRVKLAEASVKNLTGGDRIRARKMREDPWSFSPSHSLWLQTNHLPEISGRDTGIWRRIRVVRWERTFSDREQCRDLDDTLADEAPGILRWLVEGCLEWQKHGLQEPEKVIRDTLDYRNKEDTFSRFAADTGLVFGAGLDIQAKDLQDMLSEWASEEGVDPPRQEVGDWLKDNGARKRQRRVSGPDGKERRPKFWVGVGIGGGNDESDA